MKAKLINLVSDGDKEAFKQNFANSYMTRKILIEYLEAKAKECRTAAMSKSAYDKPAWAQLQADSIGYQRALEDIKKIII